MEASRKKDPMTSPVLPPSNSLTSLSSSSSPEEELELELEFQHEEQQTGGIKTSKKKINNKNSSGMLFPATLHKILMESESLGHDDIISWLPSGEEFKIHDRDAFVEKVLPRYYPAVDPKDLKWKSFLRQINLYGFERYSKKKIGAVKFGAYRHDLFRRDNPTLCAQIGRKDGKSKVKPVITSSSVTTRRQQRPNKNIKEGQSPSLCTAISSITSPATASSISCKISSRGAGKDEARSCHSSIEQKHANDLFNASSAVVAETRGLDITATLGSFSGAVSSSLDVNIESTAAISISTASGTNDLPHNVVPCYNSAPVATSRGHHRRTLSPLSALASCLHDDEDQGLPSSSSDDVYFMEDDDNSSTFGSRSEDNGLFKAFDTYGNRGRVYNAGLPLSVWQASATTREIPQRTGGDGGTSQDYVIPEQQKHSGNGIAPTNLNAVDMHHHHIFQLQKMLSHHDDGMSAAMKSVFMELGEQENKELSILMFRRQQQRENQTRLDHQQEHQKHYDDDCCLPPLSRKSPPALTHQHTQWNDQHIQKPGRVDFSQSHFSLYIPHHFSEEIDMDKKVLSSLILNHSRSVASHSGICTATREYQKSPPEVDENIVIHGPEVDYHQQQGGGVLSMMFPPPRGSSSIASLDACGGATPTTSPFASTSATVLVSQLLGEDSKRVEAIKEVEKDVQVGNPSMFLRSHIDTFLEELEPSPLFAPNVVINENNNNNDV